MNRDNEIILDIVRSARLILEFTKDMDLETFSKDLKTQSSVLYQIVILGEAVNRLSSEFSNKYPQIPITSIRGMRNRVVHEYNEVDVEILWQVTQSNIPDLLKQVEPLILPDTLE
jgi:uncharacterized protein with HEPN domain